MQNKFEYNEVTSSAVEYLEKDLLYKYVTLRHYRRRWLLVKGYMESGKIDFISSTVCKDFLDHLRNGRDHRDLSPNEKLIEKAATVLAEFMETGIIQQKKTVTYLEGAIGMLMQDFLSYKQSRRLSQLTIKKITSHLSTFNCWLSKNHIHDINSLTQAHVINYIRSLDTSKKALIHDTLTDLRSFFSFLYDREVIPTNIALYIPKDNYCKQSGLPSYYAEEEIHQLLKSIDRGTKIGKRDYAILTLAAHLGLRASDIARLKFTNLHWDNSIIILKQYKTGRNLTLPLLPIVGNAILDYIQYGRPQSKEQHVFLLALSPYQPVKSGTIANLVHRRFVNTGLNTDKRRHGGHALRHSLVKELLQNKQALPVIMEVLGHKNIESTRHYIRIDTESLRQCALDVPGIDPLFYSQGKRYFL